MSWIRNNPIVSIVVSILGAGILADLLTKPRYQHYDEFANLPDYEPLSGGVSSGEISWTHIAILVLVALFIIMYQFEKWQARRAAYKQQVLKEWKGQWNQSASEESPPPWHRG